MFSKLTWYSELYMGAEHLGIQTRTSGGALIICRANKSQEMFTNKVSSH